MTRMRTAVIVVCCVALYGAGAAAVSAQEWTEPSTYGISDTNYHFVGGEEFAATGDYPCTWVRPYSNQNGWRGSSGACRAVAPLRLPVGSLVTGITVFYRNAAAGDVEVNLWRDHQSQGGSNRGVVASWTSAQASPTDWLQANHDVTPDFTIQYVASTYSYSYTIEVLVKSTTAALRGVRVSWKRQVSPGPATATFGDVPTSSPYFPYVEALVDAGIVAGCGSGNYCPGNPVTRGQMAVYLAVALGLHYAP